MECDKNEMNEINNMPNLNGIEAHDTAMTYGKYHENETTEIINMLNLNGIEFHDTAMTGSHDAAKIEMGRPSQTT